MKGNDYMHEAKNVSSVLGRNSSVKVVFEGSGAFTDGDTIVLPTIDAEVELDDWTVKVARGYVDHESAHVKWTDQDQWIKAINRFKRSKEHVVLKKGCLNALEDVRIEKKLIDLYAGSIDNLDAVSTEVINELQLSMDKRTECLHELSAVEIGGLAATWYGRVKHGYGQVAGEYFELLDQELQDVVKGAVDRLDGVSDTKGVVKIAEDFVAELVRMSEHKDDDDDEGDDQGDDQGDGDDDGDQGQDNEGDGDDQGESNSDDQDGEDSDSDDGNDAGTGDGDGDEADGDDGMEGSDGDGGGDSKQSSDDDGDGGQTISGDDQASINRDSVGSGDIEPYDPDKLKQEAVERALNPNAHARRRGSEFRRFSDRYDKEVSGDDLHDVPDAYEKMLNETVGQTNVLRRTLERKLAAKMKRSWVGGQTKGRLDSRRLVGAVTGSEHIYKTREETDDLDTALMIIVDHSGSMGNRIKTASSATVALAVALENTPIVYAIQGFTTQHLPDDVHKKLTSVSEYESYMPVVTLRYKEFGDRLSRVKGKLGGMRYNFCHNMCLNVDGVSIEKAGRELLKRPEKRKVLMVLSDGEPNDGYSQVRGGLERHLKNVINSLAAQGVEVFGIGIESDAVESYYPDYAVLNDVADLEKEVIGRMEGLLLDGRHVRKAS